MKNKTKAIFFDLDDTLMNTRKAEYNAICEFKNLYNIFQDIDNEIFANTWHELTTNLYELYQSNQITFQEMRVLRIKELFNTYGISISNEDAKKKFDKYFKLYEKNWMLFEDTLDVLKKLKDKYILVLISNGDSDQQRKKIEKTGLNKYFQEILISSEVGISKPDKKIFELACKKVNVNPEECIMVGDRYKVDVEGAINSGIKAIWIDRKNDDRKYEYKIKELIQLFDFIDKI